MTKYLAIATGGLLVALVVLGMLLKSAYGDLGAATQALDSANAVIKQNEKDRRRSAEEIATLRGKVEVYEKTAQPVRERIIQMPTTVACAKSPAINAAAVGVRDLLASPGPKNP